MLDHYPIGSTGPAGGIIFYNKGNSSGGWRYLEAAPAALEFQALWGESLIWYLMSIIELSTSLEIGAGQDNTETILSYLNGMYGGNSDSENYAVRICDNLFLGGFDDWFISSLGELALMHQELYVNNLGYFSNIIVYWSSLGYDLYLAWGFDFLVVCN